MNLPPVFFFFWFLMHPLPFEGTACRQVTIKGNFATFNMVRCDSRRKVQSVNGLARLRTIITRAKRQRGM